jgi:hypothetical protein
MAFSSTMKRKQDEFHLLVFPRLIFVIFWTDASHSWRKRPGPVIGARWAEVDAYLGTSSSFLHMYGYLFHLGYGVMPKYLRLCTIWYSYIYFL